MRSPRTRRARCCAGPNATPPPRRTRPSRSVPADLGQALPIDGAHPVHVSVLSGARAATVGRGGSALTGSYEAAHVMHLRVDWPSRARARARAGRLTGPWDLGQWEATRPAPCRANHQHPAGDNQPKRRHPTASAATAHHHPSGAHSTTRPTGFQIRPSRGPLQRALNQASGDVVQFQRPRGYSLRRCITPDGMRNQDGSTANSHGSVPGRARGSGADSRPELIGTGGCRGREPTGTVGRRESSSQGRSLGRDELLGRSPGSTSRDSPASLVDSSGPATLTSEAIMSEPPQCSGRPDAVADRMQWQAGCSGRPDAVAGRMQWQGRPANVRSDSPPSSETWGRVPPTIIGDLGSATAHRHRSLASPCDPRPGGGSQRRSGRSIAFRAALTST